MGQRHVIERSARKVGGVNYKGLSADEFYEREALDGKSFWDFDPEHQRDIADKRWGVRLVYPSQRKGYREETRGLFFRPTQRKIWDLNMKYPVIAGGVGAGKTVILECRLTILCAKYAGVRNLVIREEKTKAVSTFDAYRRLILEGMRFREGLDYDIVSANEREEKLGTYVRWKFPWLPRPSRMVFWGVRENSGESLQTNLEKLPGLDFDSGLIEEIEEQVSPEFFNMIRLRVGRNMRIGEGKSVEKMGGYRKGDIFLGSTLNTFRKGNQEHFIETMCLKRKYPMNSKYGRGAKLEEAFDKELKYLRLETGENEKSLPEGYAAEVAQRKDAASTFKGHWANSVLPGVPVLEHVNSNLFLKSDLQYFPERTMYRGWDLGVSAKWMACVWGQFTPQRTFQVLLEYVSNEHGTAVGFVREVIRMTREHFPELEEQVRFLDVGDPDIKTESKATEGSAMYRDVQSIVRHETGVRILTGKRHFIPRKESLLSLFRMLAGVDDVPAIAIDADKCPLVADGVRGNWRYTEKHGINWEGTKGSASEPIKDKYSHPMDALSYVVDRFVRHFKSAEDDEEMVNLMTHADIARVARQNNPGVGVNRWQGQNRHQQGRHQDYRVEDRPRMVQEVLTRGGSRVGWRH